MVVVRPATVGDADGIAEVHVRAWQATYRGTFPDAFLDGMDVAVRAQRWRELLAAADAVTLVAARPRTIVGFATVGDNRDHDAEAGTGELHAIYVDPPVWGTGAGRALMAAAVESLRDRGHRAATLWVLAGNVRAERFYEAAGWRADGATKQDTLAATAVTERRYRRTL